MTLAERRSARAYVRMAATVTAGGQSWSGRTRDLSESGALLFLEPPFPSGRCSVTLHAAERPITAEAEVRFTLTGVGVGLQFVRIHAEDASQLRGLVDAAGATFGLWGLVGRYLTEESERTPSTLSVPRAGALFADLRSAMGPGQVAAGASDPGRLELHPVGGHGTAYRLLMQRPGVNPPAGSDLATRTPGFAAAAATQVRRVAAQDVWLKLHAGSQPRPYRVVELVSGGFGAVVESHSPPRPPRVSFLSLVMGELMAVRTRDGALYPFFTDAELTAIQNDGLKDDLAAAAERARAVEIEAVRARFSSFVTVGPDTESQLQHMLEADTQAETRVYGNRRVVLHPHLLMKLRSATGVELVGVPLHDGKRHCLLQLTGDGFGGITPLQPGTQVCVVLR